MKIKVFNLHKQIGNGKGDVHDWTSKQVTIENGILQSNDGGTSSEILTTKNIPNKNVTIHVTSSGSVYVTSTEQPHRAHGIAGAARRQLMAAAKPPAAPKIKQSRSRVPSGNQRGEHLVIYLQNNNDHNVFLKQNSMPFKDLKYFKSGLEEIIKENDINKERYQLMMDKSKSFARRQFKKLDESKEWWRRIYETLNKKTDIASL
jgi:hypothetical protein